MHKLILELLKAKFDGVSDTILSKIATKLAKTNTDEEKAKAAVEAYTIQMVLDSNGDSRATEAAKTAVETYEKKYNLKEGKAVEEPKPEPAPNPNGGNDTPDWAKALLESNKALTDRLNKMESERTTNKRKKAFDEAISNLPDSLKKIYGRSAYADMSDDDFTSFLTEVKNEVGEFEKESAQKSTIIGRPLANNRQVTDKVTEEQAKAVVDAMHL